MALFISRMWILLALTILLPLALAASPIRLPPGLRARSPVGLAQHKRRLAEASLYERSMSNGSTSGNSTAPLLFHTNMTESE
jgi:hypothetical protein